MGFPVMSPINLMTHTCTSPRLNFHLLVAQENLQKEQRAIMELFLKVVYQILSPIQAAQFVVESFPYHCDVLALANVLSTVFGKDQAAGAAGGGGVGGPVPSTASGGMAGAGIGLRQAPGLGHTPLQSQGTSGMSRAGSQGHKAASRPGSSMMQQQQQGGMGLNLGGAAGVCAGRRP